MRHRGVVHEVGINQHTKQCSIPDVSYMANKSFVQALYIDGLRFQSPYIQSKGLWVSKPCDRQSSTRMKEKSRYQTCESVCLFAKGYNALSKLLKCSDITNSCLLFVSAVFKIHQNDAIILWGKGIQMKHVPRTSFGVLFLCSLMPPCYA